MSLGSLKPSVLAVAVGVAFATVIAPQPASAQGMFDWIFGAEPPPPPPPPPAQKKPVQPKPKAPTAPAAPKSADAAVNEFRDQPRLDLPMYIWNVEWTDKDENAFGKFVSQLGKQIRDKKCRTVKNCMKSEEANMYAQNDPEGLILYSDCADFPYFLRSYFAYHNGLPMGFVSGISMNKTPYSSAADREDDLATARLDNSPYGNRIESRGGSTMPKSPGYERNLVEYIEALLDTVSTRTLRVGPLSPNYSLGDLYPVKIDRNGIRPGTVVHSTGHAYVVFEVDKKGGVHMIDAHPDGSVSYKVLKSSTLDRSRPDHGLGFFRFRPLHIEQSKQTGDKTFYGGKIVGTSDKDLFKKGLWSVEQWFGPGSNIAPGDKVEPNQWKTAFKKQNFFDYVAAALRDSNVTVSPDEDVQELMQSLCDEMQQRVEDVNVALTKKHNLNKVAHPSTLPMNIFSAEQPWEDTSTPGRDGRMKASVEDIIKSAVSKYRAAKAGTVPGLKFDGTAEDYVKSLRTRLADMDKKCTVTYLKSDAKKVTLSFSQVVSRLNRLSFDPYHCAEKRWGASGEELKSCVDKDKGNAWYNAQQYMRNTVGKLTPNERLVIRSDRAITLEMLADESLIDRPETSLINLGTKTPPIMNLDGNFASPKFLELLTKP